MEATTLREVRLGGGVIRYREIGTGPALLFVHGVLANGTLWRDVVARLSGSFRCIVPDLPLGGHSVPMGPEAELSPQGVARMVACVAQVGIAAGRGRGCFPEIETDCNKLSRRV